MKKTIFIVPILIGILSFTINKEEVGIISDYSCDRFLSKLNVASGKTGAPGEPNCTQCHAGSASSGLGVNTLIFSGANDEYVPGQTYTFNLDVMNSTTTGFQMTGLDNSNIKAGSFTAGTGSNIQTSSGKEYINHSGGTLSSWTFDWTAPFTAVGDVTFYLASNVANGNGVTSGDEIYLTELVLAQASAVGMEESLLVNANFNVTLNSHSNEINLHYISNGQAKISAKVYNVNGKEIFAKQLGNSLQGENINTIKLKKQLPTGVYLVMLEINSEYFTKKLFLQHN